MANKGKNASTVEKATDTAKRILAEYLNEETSSASIEGGLIDKNMLEDELDLGGGDGGMGGIGGDSSIGLGDDTGVPPITDGGLEVPGEEAEAPVSLEDEAVLKELGDKFGGEQPIVVIPQGGLKEEFKTDLKDVPSGYIGNGDPRREEWYNLMTDIIDKLKEDNDKKEKENKTFKDKTDCLELEVEKVKTKLDEAENKYISILKHLQVVLTEASTNMAKSNYVWRVLQNQNLSESKRRQAIQDITECQTLNEAKVYYKSIENIAAKPQTPTARNHLNSDATSKLEAMMREQREAQDVGIGAKRSGDGNRILGEGNKTPEQQRMLELAGLRETY